MNAYQMLYRAESREDLERAAAAFEVLALSLEGTRAFQAREAARMTLKSGNAALGCDRYRSEAGRIARVLGLEGPH